jgi:hypothetical protein
MSHAIHLPYVDRNDHLSTVADVARALSTDEDRAIARQLVLDGSASGLTTVGALLDHVAALDPAGRRDLLDRTRSRAGLPPLREARKTEAEPIADDDDRDAAGRAIQFCPEPGCRRFAADPLTGNPTPHPAKRWWCHEHAVGREEDLLPWTSPVVLGPAGLRDLAAEEAEALAQRWEAERHRLQHEQRRAAAAAALPELEHAAAAEALAWKSANLHIERTP